MITPHTVHEVLRVAFHVYAWPALPLPVAAERLQAAVALPLSRRRGRWRAEYYRWSDGGGADLLLQENVVDEEGVPVEPDAPAHAALVYATGLSNAVHATLAGVDGLRLLAADVVSVPRVAGTPPRSLR